MIVNVGGREMIESMCSKCAPFYNYSSQIKLMKSIMWLGAIMPGFS